MENFGEILVKLLDLTIWNLEQQIVDSIVEEVEARAVNAPSSEIPQQCLLGLHLSCRGVRLW